MIRETDLKLPKSLSYFEHISRKLGAGGGKLLVSGASLAGWKEEVVAARVGVCVSRFSKVSGGRR